MAQATAINTFHHSSCRLRGRKIQHPCDGSPAIEVSEGQKRRAEKKLCGIKGCECGSHQTHFEPLSNPSEPGCTYAVAIR